MRGLLEKPLGLLFILGVSVLGGIYTALNLPISMYPSIQKPRVSIWFNTDGINSVEAYETYIEQIRRSLRSIEDSTKDEVSFYSHGVRIDIDFDYSKPREDAKREVTIGFEGLRSLLPENMRNRFSVYYDERDSGEYIGMFLSKKGRSSQDIYETVHPLVAHRLSGVPDVDTNQSGLQRLSKREIVVEFDEIKLLQHGLFLPQVIRTIRSQISNFPSGKIVADRSTIFIRTVLNENQIETFQNITLKSATVNSGVVSSLQIVRLSDVARVFIDEVPSRWAWRAEGQPSNMMSVKGVPGGNLWAISQGVKGILEEIKTLLPEDIHFKTYLDPSIWIGQAIKNVIGSAIGGTLIAVLVIFLFLGSFKSTTLIGLSIPTSLVLSILAMKMADININMISLGGMALAVGMIVDSSIVVLENIYRAFEKDPGLDSEKRIEVIVGAVNEVKWPVIISTLTSVIVFLPLSLTSAMAHAILGDMSLVVVFGLVASVVAALVYLPIFSTSLLGAEGQVHPVAQSWKGWIDRLCNQFYIRFLNRVMKRKRYVFLICIFSFSLLGSLSAYLVQGLRKEIVAEPEAKIFRANFNAKYVSGSAEVMKLIDPFEKVLLQPWYQERVAGFVSAAGDKWGNIRMLLKEETDAEAFEKRLEKDFASTPDVRIRVRKWNPTSLPLPQVFDAVVAVDPKTPKEIEDAFFLCSELDDKVLADPDTPFASAWCEPWNSARHEIQIFPDKYKLQRIASEFGSGLSARDLSDYVQAASDKKYLGEVFFQGEPLRIFGRFKEGLIKDAEDVRNLSIPLSFRERERRNYPLKTFATIKTDSVPPMVKVVNGVRNVVMYGQLKLDHKNEKKAAQKYVAEKIDEVREEFPEHAATFLQKNPYEDVDRSISSLFFSLALSLILIMSVLVLQFQSIKQSLIIMLAIPLGVFGVVISLWVFDSSLSLNSMLGVILLSGVAVNNSILIVDFFNSIRARGVEAREAILEAVKIRFRPILMTMMTTIFAMLPIALSLGAGGKTLQPLGVAVSGGLLVSTLFTLVIVPLALFLAYGKGEKA